MELVKISELPIKEITTVDAYLPIIDNVGEDIENYRISLLNLFKTGGIINVNRTYGDGNYTLQTALAVIEPTLLTNGVFITFRGMDGWELYQKDLSNYVKYVNTVDDELENGSDNPISNDAVTRMYYELLGSINTIAQITHKDLMSKNAETNFQHVDTNKEVTFFDKLAVLNTENKVVTSSVENINKIEKKATKFGRLYSVPTAKNPNLVGQGFRLPSIEDWETLIGVKDETNNYSTEYRKYLSTNTGMWSVIPPEAVNEHNFNIVGSGHSPYSSTRAFEGLLTFAQYHTSSMSDEYSNNYIYLRFNTSYVTRDTHEAPAQFNSIRFCRDLTASESTYNDGAILEPYTDFEGYKYEVRKIGNLAWMCENLMTEYYLDGTKLIANQADYGIDEVRDYDDLASNVYSFRAVDKDVAKSILYEDLFALREAGDLPIGMQYLITDYTTTTAQTDTQSAGHDFNIIVTALSSNELSEIASCVRKEGDTYFTNAKLEAWEIKYCIDNNVNRFAWADAVNGKGVIYYMKDEWGNECPYDFKNIQFKKLGVFSYTFGGAADDSLTGGCYNNIMMASIDYNPNMLKEMLTLNFNMFGKNCTYNTLGGRCFYNTFGNQCSYNTFGNFCGYNTFGNSCQTNTFGNFCQTNTFGYNCFSNTFGDECFSNTFGDECQHNTFGNQCRNNNFYTGTSGTTKKNYIRYIVLEGGCSKNNFYSSITTSSSSYLQRIRIKGLQNTSATNTQISLSATNTKYEWLICYTSSSVLKQYCPNN